MDSNNSNLLTYSIIEREGGSCERRKSSSLSHGKYIEYKSCQINKINVVPITIIFERREIVI